MELPRSVQEIADVIGRDRALLLVGKLPRSYTPDRRWPSREAGPMSADTGARNRRTDRAGASNIKLVMYVPTLSRLTLDHRLVQILGWADAEKLCKAFGGEIMYPASCAAIARQFKNDSILRMARTGIKSTAVAIAFGVSERHVRNLLRENPPEECPKASNDNALVFNDMAHATA